MESGTAAQSGEKALGGGVRDSCVASLSMSFWGQFPVLAPAGNPNCCSSHLANAPHATAIMLSPPTPQSHGRDGGDSNSYFRASPPLARLSSLSGWDQPRPKKGRDGKAGGRGTIYTCASLWRERLPETDRQDGEASRRRLSSTPLSDGD